MNFWSDPCVKVSLELFANREALSQFVLRRKRVLCIINSYIYFEQ